MILLVAWVLCAAIFAPLAAFKAKRMGGPFFWWLLAGLALPLVTLAVVQWVEAGRARDRRPG